MANKNNTNAKSSPQLGFKPWILSIPLLLIGLFNLPSATVIAVGMVPTMVARVIDTSPGKRLSITVGAMNLVGCLYFVHRIWSAGHRLGDVPMVLGDSFGWLSALMGAGAGWVIFGATPLLITQIAQAQTAVRLRRLTNDQDRLAKEWGESVRGVYGVRTVEKEAGEG